MPYQNPLSYRTDIRSLPRSTLALDNNASFTIGDLHGSALKLLHFLNICGVLQLTLDQYQKLSEVHNGILTPTTCYSFINVLASCRVYSRPLIRLIGDMLCDRGNNDFFTLAILDFLQRHQVPYEILLSNHDYGFIMAHEQGYPAEFSYLIRGQDRSLLNLLRLMQEDTSGNLRQTVAEYYERVYCPYVKLFSYELMLDRSAMKIYSHAIINLETIVNTAASLGLGRPLTGENFQEIATVITEINGLFQREILQQRRCNEALGDLSRLPEESPFFQLTWARKLYGPLPKRQDILFVHGHCGEGLQASSVHINLDTNLGRTSIREYGYTVAYSGNMTIDYTAGSLRTSPENLQVESKSGTTYDTTEVSIELSNLERTASHIATIAEEKPQPSV